MIPVEITQTPWHFTTGLDAFDHWQSLVAGGLALLAAVIVVCGGEFFARCKERREVAAIRTSLGVEIRHFVVIVILTRKVLISSRSAFKKGAQITASQLKLLAELPEPVIFPAIANRIGHLGPLAGSVVAFYAKIEQIKYSVKVVADPVEMRNFNDLTKEFEQTCRESRLLLNALPVDVDKATDTDTDINAEIEGMVKPDSTL